MDGTGDTDGLTGDYQRAGFAGRLGLGRRPAVLIVDIVRAYLDASSPLYAEVEDAVASAARVVAAARGGGGARAIHTRRVRTGRRRRRAVLPEGPGCASSMPAHRSPTSRTTRDRRTARSW